MSRMVEFLERLDLPEGFSQTHIEGVRIFKARQHLPRTPILYDPGIVIIAQGKKMGYVGNQIIQYDPNNYLVLSVTIPIECETFASPDNPLLGIYIDIDIPQLHDLIYQIGHQTDINANSGTELQSGIGPAVLDENMTDAMIRLVKCLQSETESHVLGAGLVREILFRALLGSQAPMLHTLVKNKGNFSRIVRALKIIHQDYAKKLDIEQLANQAGMSVSSFHRTFKAVTADSPMQYLKKYRLNKARDFIIQDGIKTYIAAAKVGYESVSQFSREFKRYFGQSPANIFKGIGDK